MKIWLLSDLHWEFERWSTPRLGAFPDADVCVVPGDVYNGCPNAVHYLGREVAVHGMPVVFVPGNHEFYGHAVVEGLADGRRAAQDYPGLHFLSDDTVVLDGVRFVGSTLWTDYALDGEEGRERVMEYAGQAMNDHRMVRLQDNPPRRSFLPFDALSLHRTSRAFLDGTLAQPFDGPTVIVTHHAPHPGSAHPRFAGDPLNGAFASDLTDVIEKHRPDLWLHGHMHNNSDYVVGDTRVVCNPLGYRSENPEFQPRMVLEVEPRPSLQPGGM